MISNRQLFLSYNAQTTEMPLLIEIERAEGVYMYGPNNERYLDLISGIGVSNIGHRNQDVVNAIKEQSEKYLHLMVYGEYVQSPQVLVAKELCDLLPASLDSVYLVNSGAEAIEGAMKLAKRVTAKHKIMACKNSYHGSTQGALSIMGNEEYKSAYRPLLPGINFIEFGNIDDIEKIDDSYAAVVIECVQGESGIRVASKEYWQKLRKKCDENCCLLILDEIQSGMGRTGKNFAFEHYDIVPDVLVLAKALGAGLPIGAFVANRKLMHAFTNNPILGHITTFGGHPLSCAAALAGIRYLRNSNLVEDIERKHQLFKKLLVHKSIKEIRGIGFMLAIQLESFEFNKKVIDRCIEKGVITDWFLHCSDAMRIAPPLIINDDEIEYACNTILEALDFASAK